MANSISDGDVLTNKLNLGLAKHKALLASWMGCEPGAIATNEATEQAEDDDLKQDHAYDRLGVGSILPKDIADGSFTRRIPSSDDKLLVRLLGAKKAKAHVAAQQEAARSNAGGKPQRDRKPAVVRKDESDEEEGRAAAFKSKRRKRVDLEESTRDCDSDNEDEETRAKRLAAKDEAVKDESTKNSHPDTSSSERNKLPEEEEAIGSRLKESYANSKTSKPTYQKTKTKPKSFLDEILAERSKKKSKKNHD